ncbi:prolipoprotein diacylglyceryl transferase family protein [Geobacter sp. SVR]|uniref:prolipoprotein diacylglyceryl transferase family protein n=1 Tax=Geobacter sp. SVR TaxID=2495594 RepID=UPI00143EF705|nr:prolipoprotein diacylglyceryl transferase family protein [Geobacter sp. SVR]BCS53373.1 hypothetical protein GSVR_16810 [Geobacter sp. SVR]GCF85501.1 hypothetical protein GSbR_21010 [Geobacter sp. SVR]
MTTTILTLFTLLIVLYLWWGFRCLPAEQWQIFAAVPAARQEQGSWQGINFTWYGLLTANAYLVAVTVLLVLLGAVGVPPLGIALLAVALLACCVPASRLVARLVEKKAHTFTVGGAVFVGILVTPLAIELVNRTAGNRFFFQIPVMAAYAAIAIAYAFGEGLGRLACISFGCCYGKPLAATSGWLRRLFTGRCFIFSGSTKKIAYADDMEATEVIPIQAVTAVLYSACGLLATGLYLASYYSAAFLTATIVTQGWRSCSEFFRADYRGGGKISAYQIMGLIGVLYAIAAACLLGSEPLLPPDMAEGLESLWSPAVLLFLQSIWLVIFLYTGRSTVTGAILTFHVHRDRV